MGHQLDVLAWICFCGPGLFNALTSFASGLSDPRVAFAGNAIVYISFALCSLLASALVPVVGLRRSLTLGALGYVTYAAALWNVHSEWVAPLQLFYAACVTLGIAAAFLWTAQGVLLLTHAHSETRGESVGRFWMIFNLGATAGGVLSFAFNADSDSTVETSSAMYAAFLLLMSGGAVLAWVGIHDTVNQQSMDAKALPVQHATGQQCWHAWQQGAVVARAVATSRSHATIILCLTPLFCYSNWFYAYHAFYNVAVFRARTRGLASACYWLAQIAGAQAAGRYLDIQMHQRLLRKQSPWTIARRFLLAFGALAAVMWTIGWFVQDTWLQLRYTHSRNVDVATSDASVLVPALMLYVTYGLHDALCQVWLYWFLSLVAKQDVVASSVYAGVYKSVQATSAAAAWYIGAIETAPPVQLQLNFVLCVVSVACAVRCCDIVAAREQIAEEGGGRSGELSALLVAD